MKPFILLVWSWSFTTVSTVTSNLFPHMINDFLNENYGPSSRLTEFTCNRKRTYLNSKLLTKYLHPYSIENIKSDIISYPVPGNNVIFLIDLLCEDSIKLLQMANKQKMFSAPYKWFIYYNTQETMDIISKYLMNIDILMDSDVTIAKQNVLAFEFAKIFRRRQNLSYVFEEIGSWSENDGLIMNYNKVTAIRRKNLMGITLNNCIVITHNDTLNHLSDKRDKHIDSITKVNYVLVEHIGNILNVSLKYSIRSSWGYFNKTTGWSGMIGELTRKEADIGGTALFLTVDRIDVIDYVSMTTRTRSKFVFRQPKLSYVTNVFILPFDIYVWISTIFLGIIISINLFIVVKWEWTKVDISQDDRKEKQELHDSFMEVAMLTYGAVCQQGATSIPISLPGRIITLFLFVSFMFLYTSYAANIVALLQSSSNNIQTLEDLLKSRLQVGVDDTVFNHFYFPTSTEPIRKALYLQKVAPPGRPPNFMPIQEGVRRMREGLFAFHMETGPGYKIVSETFLEDEKCGLQEIQFIQVPDPWLAVQKNSSYKEIIKIGLRLIQESGIQYRELILIYSKKPSCLSRGSSFISVGLVDCYPAAVVLVAGILAAIIVFLLETYIYHRVRFYKRRRGMLNQQTTNNSTTVSAITSNYLPYID